MRPEARAWLSQAQADLAGAEANVAPPRSSMAAFYAHEAAEKALKALFIATRRELPPKTQDLVALGNELRVPSGLMTKLREMNADYVATRYPDAANGVPADNYDARVAEERVGYAREVLGWVKRQSLTDA